MTDPFDDKYRHLKDFPDHVLRDLGRNDSAQRDYRKRAVEILLVRKSAYAKHDDLRELVYEIEAELDGVQFEYPAPEQGETLLGRLPEGQTAVTSENWVVTSLSPDQDIRPYVIPAQGPLVAAVTTKTLFGSDVVENEEPHAPD